MNRQTVKYIGIKHNTTYLRLGADGHDGRKVDWVVVSDDLQLLTMEHEMLDLCVDNLH